MADVAPLLRDLGFGEYEARAYASLVSAGTANGYEIAKASGMPRANVYAVLEKLVQRGAARRIKQRTGVRYAAIPPRDLLRHLESEHARTLAAAGRALEALARSPEVTPVFNLKDESELHAQVGALIGGTRRSLLAAIRPPEAAKFASQLRDARSRGVAITTLCMDACAEPCGGCQGDLYRYCVHPDQRGRWLLLVADEARMVAAEIDAQAMRAIATEQFLVVSLASAYIRQSIALATLAGELGEKFHGLLSEHARQVLDALHPEGGFFEHLKEMTGTVV
ncbi:MAG TPA: helix-turn-helix domain-containing protein [Gammaproteobacteria bacterium]|nr:helix-turn-helix domain-containing protein [Gammaproteobacteria bacterium]